MTKFVVKKDGKKVPFDLEKIRSAIAGACNDAAVTEDEKNVIVQQVSASVVLDFKDKEEVTTDEIKEIILAELDNTSSFVAKHWREYEQTKKSK